MSSLGLPLGLETSTWYSIHYFTQLVFSFPSTCPYRLNLFCRSINIISSIPSVSLNSLLGTLSFTLTLHIHPQVHVTIIRNIHNHRHHLLPNNWTWAKFLWLNSSDVVPPAKNFQQQLNSSRFPVFPGVVDTMLNMWHAEYLSHIQCDTMINMIHSIDNHERSGVYIPKFRKIYSCWGPTPSSLHQRGEIWWLTSPRQISPWLVRWLQMFYTSQRDALPLQNCPFPWGIWTPTNTWFPGPTQIINPNCISIGSAIFAGLTSVTDRPTDHNTLSVTIGHIYVCTLWAIKRSQLIFVCNFVKNQWILINVATLPCESQNTKNVILQRDITKENCIRCIIVSSKWTKVIMCLTLTYLGCYTAKHAWNKDSWHRRPANTLDAKLFWLWPECHQCWSDHLKSCVYAGGGHSECMLWPECSFIWFTRTFYETVNVICCMNSYFVVYIKSWSCVHMHFQCFDFHKVV